MTWLTWLSLKIKEYFCGIKIEDWVQSIKFSEWKRGLKLKLRNNFRGWCYNGIISRYCFGFRSSQILFVNKLNIHFVVSRSILEHYLWLFSAFLSLFSTYYLEIWVSFYCLVNCFDQQISSSFNFSSSVSSAWSS